MQITVSVRRTIIIDDDVHTLDINTTTENISSNQNTFFECFEGRVSANTIGGQNLENYFFFKEIARTVLPAEDLSE